MCLMMPIDLVAHLAVFNINIGECIITNGDIAREISSSRDKKPGRIAKIAAYASTQGSPAAG
jgi:hypothetical protein